jgi:hypothetical protein
MSSEEILARYGFPLPIVVLDMETYFDKTCSVRKQQTVEYVTHPKFKALSLATNIEGVIQCNLQSEVANRVNELRGLYGPELEKCTVVAHNAFFDCSILSCVFGVVPRYVLDTRFIDMHLEPNEGHALSEICDRWKIPYVKGDMKRFEALEFAFEFLWEELKLDNENDVRATRRVLDTLLPRITAPEHELYVMSHTTRLGLNPRLRLDVTRAKNITQTLQLELAQLVTATGHSMKEINSDYFEVLFLDALGSEAPTYREGKSHRILAISKKDPEALQYFSHPSPRVQQLVRARSAVKSYPLHIRRIQKFVGMAKALSGGLVVPLHYGGAHTGRFSGADGINYQNLAKRSHVPRAAELRECIQAPDGYSLLVADQAQGEARVVAWLGGELGLLDDFRLGRDPYSKFASKVSGKAIRKAKETDSPEEAKFLTNWRFLGKTCVLGAGFGLGHERLLAQLSNEPDIDPALLTEQNCLALIQTFRTSYRGIVTLWYDLGETVRDAIEHPNVVLSFNRFKIWTNILLEKPRLTIQLPSGRCLFYDDPHMSGTQIMLDGKKTWGGTTVENAVQAISRDLLAHSLRLLEEAGLPVAYHVHDSVACVCRDADVVEAREIMHRILCTPMPWATGLPVEWEIKVTKTFD